jgi:hypothetical protein
MLSNGWSAGVHRMNPLMPGTRVSGTPVSRNLLSVWGRNVLHYAVVRDANP